MTCDQSELRMAELLAGEIAPADRAELERHLLDCEPCREDFEFARTGARVEWADVPVPPALIESTLASIKEAPPVVRFFRWATAAAALISVAVLLVTSSRSQPRAATPAPIEAGAACTTERPTVLATMQEPGLGLLACQDDAGRPVGDLGLRSHDVSVEILDGIAKTTVEENFENHTDRRLEGTFTFPLPSDASISRLALEVNGKIEEGTCLERERARQVFESIVRRMQDPALLEWQPGGLFKCRIFPIEPRATKRVIVAYTQTLPCFQGKMRYVYPLASEKTRTHPPGEVRINVLARFSGALSKMESTSHHLDVQRKDPHEAAMSFRATNYRPNNDFVVTMEPTEEEVRVVCHKPEGEDGYFACFATPKAAEPRVSQKYTFVLDASASISAPRLEVAKRLVRAMMERKIDGDRFELLAHSVETQSSGEVDLRGANTFMDALRPIGGSDVLKALQAAGSGEIIYIGKGQPTFGETEVAKILETVKGLRIRTIAVGSDANLPLLERLGGLMRITPNDEVDKRVGEIAATLGSPVISDIKIEGDRLSDVNSARDVFAGERMVAVGRYQGAGTRKVVLSGRGYRREIDVTFADKEDANNPVRRLWAQRKVADLMAQGESKKAEITALGVKYQIMTPYTSFLVLESEQMWKDHQLQREVQKQDQVLGKACMTADEALKVQVTRKVAHLLELAYLATDQKKFDRTMKLCDEILTIDPNYPVARDLRMDAEKSRHKEEYSGIMAARVDGLKKLTDDDQQPKIPQAEKLRVPSREEWATISKRITSSVIKTEGGTTQEEDPDSLAVHRKLDTMKVDLAFENTKLEDILGFIRDFSGLNIILDAEVRDRVNPDKPVTYKSAGLPVKENLQRLLAPLGLDYTVTSENVVLLTDPRKKQEAEQQRMAESRQHYEQALKFNTSGDFDKTKVEAQKAVEVWHENIAARKLLNDVNRITVGGEAQPDDARSGFRLEVDQAQIEIAKHVRDGERYLNARMYDQATKEFENAEFKIQNMPYDVSRLTELLPQVRQSLVRSRNDGTLMGERTEREKLREAEAVASAQNSEWEELLNKLKSSTLEQQAQWKKADDHYRLAERYYTAGDFEKSQIESQKAMSLDSQHAAAQALHTETQFILGRSKATPATQEYDSFMHDAMVRHQSVLVEVDSALERGRRLQAAGDLTNANREFRKVIEYSKWMPTGVEVESRRKLAMDLAGETGGTGYPGFSSQETPRLESWGYGGRNPTTSVTAPGAPITDALPIREDIPLMGFLFQRQPKGIQAMTEDLDDLTVLDTENSGKAEAHVDMARQKKHLEEKINAIAQNGGTVNTAPKKALEGKVTAIAGEIGLVVISIGKDDGVLEGDEFTIYRGGEFVAKLVVDRADRKWCAGKILLKKNEPKVGDDVSNHLFFGAPPLKRAVTGKVTALAIETGLVVISLGTDDGVQRGDEFAIRRNDELVAKIVIDRVDAAWAAGKIVLKKSDPKVADDVTKEKGVKPPRKTISTEERLDLQSDANLESIRLKMRSKE